MKSGPHSILVIKMPYLITVEVHILYSKDYVTQKQEDAFSHR